MIDARYAEKPRASLYNVITKIKEKGAKATNWILFVGKLNDSVKNKDDLEKEVT